MNLDRYKNIIENRINHVEKKITEESLKFVQDRDETRRIGIFKMQGRVEALKLVISDLSDKDILDSPGI